MVCSNCGTNIDDSLEFCPGCSIRNENYKNPFIPSNPNIENTLIDPFSTTSNYPNKTEEASILDKSNEPSSNTDNTETVKHDEGSPIGINNTEPSTYDNTLPPIENIPTPSSEIFKTEESNIIPPVNDISSSSGEVFLSSDVPVDKKKLSKKNRILIIGGAIILVIVLSSLFILNIIFAKSPKYVLTQMLKQESSLEYARITYNLKINTVKTKAGFININGAGNIEDLKGKLVKYSGITSIADNVNTIYFMDFNADIESIYSNNNIYVRVTKINPQSISSLLGVKLNSWESYTVSQPSIKFYLNFLNIKNLKNIKVIGNSVINNVPVTEYSFIVSNKQFTGKLNSNTKLNLWIDTSNYNLYKITVSTSVDNYNSFLSMSFSNINQPFSVSIPSSYTKYKF